MCGVVVEGDVHPITLPIPGIDRNFEE